MSMRPPKRPAECVFTIELYSEACRTPVKKLMDESLDKHEFACLFKKGLGPFRVDLTPEVPKIALMYKNYHDAHGVFCQTDHGNYFSRWAADFIENLPKHYYKIAHFYGNEGWAKKPEEIKAVESLENKVIEIPMP